ncbi:hypothetical protein [Serratia marcescens]|uniref:Uncharacterized protein n=1 Tax=Serratia marcescens TaxID=615 RepID=A0AAP8TP29_SERMA|nr:hypothetical protein [Serratia marcescens]PNO65042.1 hypothetical protein MC70_017715 [Serratia marcescens]
MKMNRGRKDAITAVASMAGILAEPARLQLNIHPELHEHFKNISFTRKEVMSDLITQYVIDYVRSNGVEISEDQERMFKGKPVQWLTTRTDFINKKFREEAE